MHIAELEKTLLDKYKDKYAVTLAVGRRAMQIAQNDQGLILSKDKEHKSVISALIELAEDRTRIVLNDRKLS